MVREQLETNLEADIEGEPETKSALSKRCGTRVVKFEEAVGTTGAEAHEVTCERGQK